MLFAHFLGDWGTSNSWVAASKGKWWVVMFAHCMMYTGVCAIALRYIGIGEEVLGWSIWIFFTHYWMDIWKSKYAAPEKFPTWHLYIDQAYHIGVLMGIIIYQRNDFLLV